MYVRIIANPISGGGRGQKVAQVLVQSLEVRGIQTELYITRGPGDARREAARPGADIVVAVGGDGSVNEVANGLTGTGATMGILPFGTANVVASALRIPRDPELLAKLIADRSVKPIDLGLLGERRFLQSVGAGFDAAVVQAVHQRRGRSQNFATWVIPVVSTVLRYEFPPIRVTVDGHVICQDALYATAANTAYSAGVVAFTPEARLDSGVLDVCAFRYWNIPRMLFYAAATRLPGFRNRPGVVYAQGREVLFEPASDAPVPYQIDGDPAGALPARCTIVPAALQVIAP